MKRLWFAAGAFGVVLFLVLALRLGLFSGGPASSSNSEATNGQDRAVDAQASTVSETPSRPADSNTTSGFVPGKATVTNETTQVKPPTPVEPARPGGADSPPVATVVEHVRHLVTQYASMFGGDPVGTNEEITRALLGENPKQINFLNADTNQINARGELVDPWGTPYFFHQLSAHEMEVRSAGPDKIMWTDDDVVSH